MNSQKKIKCLQSTIQLQIKLKIEIAEKYVIQLYGYHKISAETEKSIAYKLTMRFQNIENQIVNKIHENTNQFYQLFDIGNPQSVL